MGKILFFMMIALFIASSSGSAIMETASHLLVKDLMAQIEPLETEISYLEGENVVLKGGRSDGLRRGQFFEIYSIKTDRYLGLVRVVEVRTREAEAEILQRRGPMEPGDLADEVLGGRLAIYGFLDVEGRKTDFTVSVQDSLGQAMTSYGNIEAIARDYLEDRLQALNLSQQVLLGMDITQAGQILEVQLVMIGQLIEMDDSILLSVRVHDITSGAMLAKSSVRLSITKELESMLRGLGEEVFPQLATIHHMQIRPKSISLFPGESREITLLCFDKDGFLIHHLEPEWSTTGDFVKLSSLQGNQVTLVGNDVGLGQVRVLVQGKSLFVDVEVLEAPKLMEMVVSPNKLEIPLFETSLFKAEGKDQYGGEMEVYANWSILTGHGTLSSRIGGRVELTPIGLGEILLQVEASGFVERIVVHVTIEIPMVLVKALPFPFGMDNTVSYLVGKDFWIAKTPVTYELWYPVRIWAEENGYLFANPGREGSKGTIGLRPWGDKNEPVTTVNWSDCIVWCNALSEYLGHEPVYTFGGQVIRNARDSSICHNAHWEEDADGFRLLSSHEWELAARYQGSQSFHGAIEYPPYGGYWWTPANFASGSTGPVHNDSATQAAAWYRVNTDSTRAVGQKPEGGNYLGLYDMSGNVWEWCFDGTPTHRVIRGGCWMSIPLYQQVAFTFTNEQDHMSTVKGFRLAKDD